MFLGLRWNGDDVNPMLRYIGSRLHEMWPRRFLVSWIHVHPGLNCLKSFLHEDLGHVFISIVAQDMVSSDLADIGTKGLHVHIFIVLESFDAADQGLGQGDGQIIDFGSHGFLLHRPNKIKNSSFPSIETRVTLKKRRHGLVSRPGLHLIIRDFPLVTFPALERTIWHGLHILDVRGLFPKLRPRDVFVDGSPQLGKEIFRRRRTEPLKGYLPALHPLEQRWVFGML
jgi:hypothetical protein